MMEGTATETSAGGEKNNQGGGGGTLIENWT